MLFRTLILLLGVDRHFFLDKNLWKAATVCTSGENLWLNIRSSVSKYPPVSSLSGLETYRITVWEISEVTALLMIRQQWSVECLEAHLTWHLPPPHSPSRSEVNFWSRSDDPARLPWEPLKGGEMKNVEMRHFWNWFPGGWGKLSN